MNAETHQAMCGCGQRGHLCLCVCVGGGLAGITHVCRVLTESADMALGAPDSTRL
jgi:hypothetical protein